MWRGLPNYCLIAKKVKLLNVYPTTHCVQRYDNDQKIPSDDMKWNPKESSDRAATEKPGPNPHQTCGFHERRRKYKAPSSATTRRLFLCKCSCLFLKVYSSGLIWTFFLRLNQLQLTKPWVFSKIPWVYLKIGMSFVKNSSVGQVFLQKNISKLCNLREKLLFTWQILKFCNNCAWVFWKFARFFFETFKKAWLISATYP